MRRALLIVLASILLLPGSVAAWTNTGGGDHGRSDWTPTNGTVIAGVHTNIRTFTLASGSTVTVQTYDGSGLASPTGRVRLEAVNIVIAGTLTAAGAGPGGGGGGGGGEGGEVPGCGSTTPPGSGGAGQAGGVTGSAGTGGGAGTTGSGGTGGLGGHGFSGACCGGGGGAGASPPGSPGTGNPGAAGTKGGYRTAAGQGDASSDESINRGSGGGGGGGGSGGVSNKDCSEGGGNGGGGGGGGGGNRGGGMIELVSTGALVISGSMAVTGQATATGIGADGGVPNTSPGGNGGSAAGSGSSAGGAGGVSGHAGFGSGGGGGGGHAGAGGGVLLRHTGPATVAWTGTIDARGGNNDAANGGTVKVFVLKGRLPSGVVLNSAKVFGGRYFTSETLRRGRVISSIWSDGQTRNAVLDAPAAPRLASLWSWFCKAVGLEPSGGRE